MNPPTTTCVQCGEDFVFDPHKPGPMPKYCSRACYLDGRRTRSRGPDSEVTVRCIQCDKPFVVALSSRQRVCSEACKLERKRAYGRAWTQARRDGEETRGCLGETSHSRMHEMSPLERCRAVAAESAGTVTRWEFDLSGKRTVTKTLAPWRAT